MAGGLSSSLDRGKWQKVRLVGGAWGRGQGSVQPCSPGAQVELFVAAGTGARSG